MIVGILALQGAFIEHKNILDNLKIPHNNNILIKRKEDVELCDGIIIPGGESTAMSIIEQDVFLEIRNHVNKGKAIWGTCAGLILLANEIEGKIEGQKNIGGLDIKIKRNYFGSQINSFIKNIPLPKEFKKKELFQAIFIRGPAILKINKNVKILTQLESGEIVAVQQNNILGTSFHPELSNNSAWHEYFISLISK